VLVLKNFLGKKESVADVLSGLGARAVRYANEGGFKVTANDIQPSAVKLIKRNARLNKVKIKIENKEANQFMVEKKYEKFDCIDLDPFGSPVKFLAPAMFAVKPTGLLCVTATDIGTLSGIYPTTCLRRYFILSGKTSFPHELGVRNLITVILRESSKHDFSVKPLLSYANAHYYRVFLKITGGRKTANRDLRKLGYVGYCGKCDYRKTFPLFERINDKCVCGEKIRILGPTFIGKIQDKKFLEKISEKDKILKYCYLEADLPEFYYDLHNFAKIRKKNVRKVEEVIKKITEKGFKASRTHFCSHGIKTNADFKTVKKIF